MVSRPHSKKMIQIAEKRLHLFQFQLKAVLIHLKYKGTVSNLRQISSLPETLDLLYLTEVGSNILKPFQSGQSYGQLFLGRKEIGKWYDRQ